EFRGRKGLIDVAVNPSYSRLSSKKMEKSVEDELTEWRGRNFGDASHSSPSLVSQKSVEMAREKFFTAFQKILGA
ncbi:hypothetical protein ACLOJK_037543, partial [Asimina triloba]